MAVGIRLGHGVRADHAAGAGTVLHHDGPLPRLAERLGDGTGQHVGGAARRIGHHQPHGPGRKALGTGGPRPQAKAAGSQGAGADLLQCLAARVLHRCS